MWRKKLFTFFWILISFYFLFIEFVEAVDIQSSMLPSTENNIISDEDNWFDILDSIFAFIKNSIFTLLMLIAIWAFLYVWAKLISARGNPEELKKATINFVYIVVWLFIVSAAYAVVKLISQLNF